MGMEMEAARAKAVAVEGPDPVYIVNEMEKGSLRGAFFHMSKKSTLMRRMRRFSIPVWVNLRLLTIFLVRKFPGSRL